MYEEVVVAYLKVLGWQFPRGTEENYENLQSG
jgi:hypothetical protein